MNTEDPVQARIQAFLDDLLSEQERAALFLELRESPVAAREFARLTRLESALRQALHPEPALSLSDLGEELATAPAQGRWWHWPNQQILDHLWGPASAVLLHAALILLILRWALPRPNSVSEQITPVSLGRQLPPLEPFESAFPDMDPRTLMIPDLAYPMEVNSYPDEAVANAIGIPLPDAWPVSTLKDAAPDSKLKVPAVFLARIGSARTERHAQAAPGWGVRAEQAARSGLDWMRSTQASDGSWSEADGGSLRATALAAAAFLSFAPAPGDPQGRPALQAIRFLETQQRKDGRFDLDPGRHAMATLAFAEAWGLWRLPEAGARLDAATAALLLAQDRDGYWESAEARSVSALGWQAHALALILQLHPDREEVRLAAAHLTGLLKTQFDPAKGLFLFPKNVSPLDRNRTTAMAVSALQALGEGSSAECQQGRQFLLRQSASTLASEFTKAAPDSLYFLFDVFARRPGADSAGWLAEAARTVLAEQSAAGAWTDSENRLASLNTSSVILALSSHVRYPLDISAHRTLRSSLAQSPLRSHAKFCADSASPSS